MSDLGVIPEIGDLINQRYQATRRIGAGSFGAIYEVQDVQTGKILAIKLEKPSSPSPQLQYEYKIYQLLEGAYAIPRVYDYWSEERWRGMVMDRLGSSLGSYFRKCGKILSMKTVLMCAIQFMCRLEYLHQRCFVHRDIKPDNFVFGVGKNSGLLYVIDLGLAKKYRDLKTFQHINYAEDKGLAGTARYVSINVHLGVEQSCRDDLESIGYVLITLIKGSLPWQGVGVGSKGEKYDAISQAKMDTSNEALCSGLPSEFLTYIQRVKALRFDERPAYNFLRSLFIGLMIKLKYPYDYEYDWVLSRSKRLDGALRGLESNEQLIIPVSTVELECCTRKNPRDIGFLRALPFYSLLGEAALFVGHSKGKGEDVVKEDTRIKFCEEQTMFILDPRRTNITPGKMELEFEVA